MIHFPILLTLLTVVIPSIGAREIKDILDELDKTIERREIFSSQKERRISELRNELGDARPEEVFPLSRKLFDEYKYYQYDSAYHYARRLESLASDSGNENETVIAQSALLFCFKSVGYFKEAVDIIDDFERRHPENLPHEILVPFYMLCAETWQNLSSYVHSSLDLHEKYSRLKLDYYERILEHSDGNTYEHEWISLELSLLRNYSMEAAINGRRSLIAKYNLDEHEQAVQYSILSAAFAYEGMDDESIYYRAVSAINDIRSCTRETTSAKALAESLYWRGEIARPYRYIQQALSDAEFYNTSLRIVELNAILTRIESVRYDWINSQRVILLAFAGAILLLLAITLILFLKLRGRNRQLSQVHGELVRTSDIIRRNNESLSELNDKLKEANEIKDEYIISSLYSIPDFLNEVEKQSLLAVRKILTRQYDDAVALLNNMGVKKERERVYASFDSAFLKLFPNFIAEFNALFPPESQFMWEGMEMPMEVRIFALLRLGIDNTSQVAEYLNLSVNTVYVYKTKVKSRSFIPNDEFEKRIMVIPKP